MSPLRRLWLAWGGWELLLVTIQLGLLAVMAIVAQSIQEYEPPPIGERPLALLLLVTIPLGTRLRSLLSADCLGLARSHASWVLRWCCLVILPAVALGMTMLLALTGVPLLWSAAIAAVMVAVGAWMGFAAPYFLSVGPLWAALFLVVVVLPHLVKSRDGWAGDALAAAALIVVGLGVRTAWQQLETRAVPARSHWRSWHLDQLSAWFDACVMRQPAAVVARGPLPTLLTAARIGLSGLGGSWLLRLIGTVVMCIFAFAVNSREPATNDSLSVLMPIITLCAFAPALGWFSAGKGENPLASRGLLASQRLLPLPRRQAAAATMLSLTGNCLSSVLPLTGGMLLGLLLSDAWLGRDSSGLWMLLPHALMATACSMAGMLLLLVLPLAVAITGGAVLAVVLIVAPIVDHLNGAGAYLAAPLIAAVLALVLVPLAWWRLAEVELP